MTFYDFVVERYSGKDTPRGDFAYDIEREQKYFPVVYDADDNSRQKIKDYLIRNNACSGCMKAFRDCWTSYRNYMQKQKENA